MNLYGKKEGKKKRKKRENGDVFRKKEFIRRLIFSVALPMNERRNLIIILRSVSYENEKNEAQQFKAERRFP